jgi:hypothetical protein
MAAAWAQSASVGGRSNGRRGGAGEIRKFLLGVPFDEQRDEVADRCISESVVDRAHDLVHGIRWHMRGPRQQAVDHLPDQSIFFGRETMGNMLRCNVFDPTSAMNEKQPHSQRQTNGGSSLMPTPGRRLIPRRKHRARAHRTP